MIELTGVFAVMMLGMGLFDVEYNGCQSNCFAKSHDAERRINISAGETGYNGEVIGQEIYLRYDLPLKNGPFQHTMGVSITDTNDFWIGAGQLYFTHLGQTDFYTELHAMTGLYVQGDGKDLGGLLEFRSGIELGYEMTSGWRLGVSLDHRSNAELGPINPGLETLQFRVSSAF